MKRNNTNSPAGGFTLIELLVTIAILGVVAVIVIPAVRTLNKDRKVRDTARVVGSAFAEARERAAVDGWAGVEIVPLARDVINIAGVPTPQYNVPNMGMLIYQLRSVPPWSGDYDDTAINIAMFNTTSRIGTADLVDSPADSLLTAANIRPNDYIEFNNSGVRYRITNVVYETLGPIPPAAPGSVDFLVGNHDPVPPLMTPLSFRIYRQPVRIESSVIRLPNNLFLNMAWSGHGTAQFDPDPATNQNQYSGFQFRDFFNTAFAGHPDPGNYPNPDGSTRIWFNRDGSIDQVTTRAYIPMPGGFPPLVYDYSYMEPPAGPVYLLMCNGDGDEIDVTNLADAAYLADDNNLWIEIDNRNGNVSIGRMAEFSPIVAGINTVRKQVQDSRAQARTRRSATP